MRLCLATMAFWLALSPGLRASGDQPPAPGATAPRAGDACRPALVARQRYGFVSTREGWPQEFDVARLRAGWAADQSLGAPPAGMDRVLVLHTPYGYRVNPAILGPLVDANPGATWLIGNEPDSIWQDDLPPAEYARIYHDLYVYLKGRDASARAAAGGIVQPTPLRLQYLDLVLAAYQARYGRTLPADLWHIHNAILNEVRESWGADIPPGVDADVGVIREIDDNDNLDIFTAQIWAFRQWMVDRGYGGLPIFLSEFGVLMPKEYGFDPPRVNAFMSGTFAFLATASDPVLGDPLDGGRLVQRWAWFSLDVPPFEVTPTGFNGNLFDPLTAAITLYGLHYEGLTAGLPALDYAELGLVRWQVPPVGRPLAPGETVTLPVTVRLGNSGTAAAAAFPVRLRYSGPRQGTLQQEVPGLPPRGTVELTFDLADLVPGSYELELTIDASDRVQEPAECDNQHFHDLVVPTHLVYLPLAMLHGGPLLSSPSAAAIPSPPSFAGKEGGRATHPALLEFPLPQPGSYPGQLAVDQAGGALWVTERDGNRLARLDPATGDWTEFPIPTSGSQPWGLALDGTGSLWFAETAEDQIGRLDLATGNITEYDGLAPGSEPWGVAVDGRDGWFVWFTARQGDTIGRLDPDTGDVIEYSLHQNESPPWLPRRPSGLSASSISSSGVTLWYLWFAEPGSNKLGRMRLADNAIAELTLPSPNSAPEDVVWEGGLVWITELAANKIATFGFGTTNLWTEIPLPIPNSEPYAITLQGSDLVWFTERAGNRLGRYRVSTGALVEYPLPTPGSQPTDIAVDAAGCAWYAAPGADRVGRLCPSALEHIYLPMVVR